MAALLPESLVRAGLVSELYRLASFYGATKFVVGLLILG
jgi:hypothetical protein